MDKIPIHVIGCDFPCKGSVLDREGRRIIDFRLQHQIDSIEKHMGEVIIWSDVDIVFLDKIEKHVLKFIKGVDLCGIHEHLTNEEMNGGFLCIRCSKKTKKFFEMIRDDEGKKQFRFYEQDAMNRTWKKFGLSRRFLPANRFSCYHYNPRPNLRNTVAYHVNSRPQDKIRIMMDTLSAARKIRRLFAVKLL
jgi:hypothetical protein